MSASHCMLLWCGRLIGPRSNKMEDTRTFCAENYLKIAEVPVSAFKVAILASGESFFANVSVLFSCLRYVD